MMADRSDFAFPNGGMTAGESGMTLRDWFAGQALQGILAGRYWEVIVMKTDPINTAYAMADEMLAERQK